MQHMYIQYVCVWELLHLWVFFSQPFPALGAEVQQLAARSSQPAHRHRQSPVPRHSRLTGFRRGAPQIRWISDLSRDASAIHAAEGAVSRSRKDVFPPGKPRGWSGAGDQTSNAFCQQPERELLPHKADRRSARRVSRTFEESVGELGSARATRGCLRLDRIQRLDYE